jgi:hypothetical protein
VDVVVASWRVLSASEREVAFETIARLREELIAGDETEGERMVTSLRRAVEFVGREPSVDDYKDAVAQLGEQGVELEPLHRVVRHFGSWRLAKEALALTEVTTVRRIEARFRSRKLGKVWRYTDQTLEETFRRCHAELGRAPALAEFEFWRERQIEVARARGEGLHLPSATPYRKRFGSWEGTLSHYGIAGDDATRRFPGA